MWFGVTHTESRLVLRVLLTYQHLFSLNLVLVAFFFQLLQSLLISLQRIPNVTLHIFIFFHLELGSVSTWKSFRRLQKELLDLLDFCEFLRELLKKLVVLLLLFLNFVGYKLACKEFGGG